MRMNHESNIRDTALKGLAGGAVVLSMLSISGPAAAEEECTTYPPSPCNTIPPEERPTTTLPVTTTTEVTASTLPNTGNEGTGETLGAATIATVSGFAIYGLASVSRRRQNARS